VALAVNPDRHVADLDIHPSPRRSQDCPAGNYPPYGHRKE
jgi:hypothetical protein